MHGTIAPPPRAADLAARGDFDLAGASISPATRTIRGLGGAATVEPRVMQVLLALVDAGGGVVTREDLLRRCWGDRFVGEDALNRAVGEVRRLARTVAADGFGVETIPRTGYRMTGIEATPAPVPAPAALLDRRLLIGGGVAALAAAAAAAWSLRPDPRGVRAAALIGQADQARRNGLPDSEQQGVGFLREAAALTPDDPLVWGRLALALRAVAEYAPPAATAAAVRDAEAAARRALALDPRQPDARAALAMLLPQYGDWLAAERRLRAVLADAPDHVETSAALGVLEMSVGRARASAAINARLVEREPLSPVHQYRRVYGLWNIGRIGDADRAADRAIELWPRHPGVWFVRLWTLAFTDRAALALAQVEDAQARPSLAPTTIGILRASMVALATRSPADVAAAVAANFADAPRGPSSAVNAILVLTALGALDEAFTVANGYLLRTGPSAGQLRPSPGQPSVNDQHYRKTMMLFVAGTAPLRADPRFLPLCEAIGLGAYWRAARVTPDFLA